MHKEAELRIQIGIVQTCHVMSSRVPSLCGYKRENNLPIIESHQGNGTLMLEDEKFLVGNLAVREIEDFRN